MRLWQIDLLLIKLTANPQYLPFFRHHSNVGVYWHERLHYCTTLQTLLLAAVSP